MVNLIKLSGQCFFRRHALDRLVRLDVIVPSLNDSAEMLCG